MTDWRMQTNGKPLMIIMILSRKPPHNLTFDDLIRQWGYFVDRESQYISLVWEETGREIKSRESLIRHYFSTQAYDEFAEIHFRRGLNNCQKTEGMVNRAYLGGLSRSKYWPHLFLSFFLSLSLFNQRNKEKMFGTFIVLPLLLGFRSSCVRSNGVIL